MILFFFAYDWLCHLNFASWCSCILRWKNIDVNFLYFLCLLYLRFLFSLYFSYFLCFLYFPLIPIYLKFLNVYASVFKCVLDTLRFVIHIPIKVGRN